MPMSYKTDALVQLLPEAFAARETESLLHKVLDAVGAELMQADEAVKALLKSHWIDYASGAALDGLGAIFSAERRVMRGGGLEPDDAFRARLRSLVPMFTGGGTVAAVVGAVRSALGLPFNLDQLKLPRGFEALRAAIERLVVLEEFSPKVEVIREDRITAVGDEAVMTLALDFPTVKEGLPRIEWTFVSGAARTISLQRTGSGEGVRSTGAQLFPAGSTLVLSGDERGRLRAVLDGSDVTPRFVGLDGSTAPRMPQIPVGRSEWSLRARGGFDAATFDADTLDLPQYRVEMRWYLYQPMTFDVTVPYFLKEAVQALAAQHRYPGELLVYEGVPIERIPQVVRDTQAAGVRGSVHFTLDFYEDQDPREGVLQRAGDHRRVEDANPVETPLVVGSVNESVESLAMRDALILGGVFDVARFDEIFGFDE